jgi:hypothetical protein
MISKGQINKRGLESLETWKIVLIVTGVLTAFVLFQICCCFVRSRPILEEAPRMENRRRKKTKLERLEIERTQLRNLIELLERDNLQETTEDINQRIEQRETQNNNSTIVV